MVGVDGLDRIYITIACIADDKVFDSVIQPPLGAHGGRVLEYPG